MKKVLICAAVVAATVFAGAAGAITVEPFDSPGPGNSNLPDPFVSQGFSYSPTTDNSGQCYNSRCLQDKNPSGAVTTVTRVGGGLFDILGFYLNMNGKGPAASNFLEITADGGASGAPVTLQILTDITATVDLWDEDGNAATELTQDSTGYFLLLKTPITGATSVSFDALNSAQLRLDCLMLSTDGSRANGVGDFNNCGPSEGGGFIPGTIPVPLPASLPLLGAALGLVLVARRRRN